VTLCSLVISVSNRFDAMKRWKPSVSRPFRVSPYWRRSRPKNSHRNQQIARRHNKDIRAPEGHLSGNPTNQDLARKNLLLSQLQIYLAHSGSVGRTLVTP
jgi:hypothetical protein